MKFEDIKIGMKVRDPKNNSKGIIIECFTEWHKDERYTAIQWTSPYVCIWYIPESRIIDYDFKSEEYKQDFKDMFNGL